MRLLKLFLPGVLFLSSCASVYTAIEPASVVFDTPPAVLYKGQVYIRYRYDVLGDAGNRKYARKEKQQGVSLIAVRIENHATDTLYFPEDLMVMVGKQAVPLLSMADAGEALRQTIAEETENEWVEIDAPLIQSTRSVFNLITQVKANDAFVKELDSHYLLPCYIAPGAAVVGLLALDVERGTPLQFLIIK